MKYKIVPPTKDKINLVLDLCEAHALFERSDYSRKGKAEGLLDDLYGRNPKLHCRVVEIENEYHLDETVFNLGGKRIPLHGLFVFI
ncbi:MAG: hypothetical protein AAGA77_20490 [Bacteroidota bacterium]